MCSLLVLLPVLLWQDRAGKRDSTRRVVHALPPPTAWLEGWTARNRPEQQNSLVTLCVRVTKYNTLDESEPGSATISSTATASPWLRTAAPLYHFFCSAGSHLGVVVLLAVRWRSCCCSADRLYTSPTHRSLLLVLASLGYCGCQRDIWPKLILRLLPTPTPRLHPTTSFPSYIPSLSLLYTNSFTYYSST